jgi:DMSO/TMAO reductase YedYZ molybdopterin-dependent catalytic subunit
VRQLREWSLAELLKRLAVTRPVTLECAGNGRSSLIPTVKGVNWQCGAVGHAEWTGVSLGDLLKEVGVNSTASEVILEGADSGIVPSDASAGPIAFARSIPLAKAMSSEVILAYQMNGHDLTPEHGWPLRAIVGGWYGMASVKWLTRIIVTEAPFQGYWQTMDYSYFERATGLPTVQPIQAMQVKSLVLRPQPGESIPLEQIYRIEGRAWAGEHAVAKVEISVDGGTTWLPATLANSPAPFVWTRWTMEWQPTRAGTARLMATATDVAGRTQPLTRDSDRRTYLINHVVPVNVTVQ